MLHPLNQLLLSVLWVINNMIKAISKPAKPGEKGIKAVHSTAFKKQAKLEGKRTILKEIRNNQKRGSFLLLDSNSVCCNKNDIPDMLRECDYKLRMKQGEEFSLWTDEHSAVHH